MIKLTAAISNRNDWTTEEWLVHYKECHGSLAASVRNFNRHSLRYLQNYAYHAPVVPDFSERDAGRAGVTELWFPSIDAIKIAYSEPDYMKYLRPDELRFCRFDNIVAGVAREAEIFEAARPERGEKTCAYAPRDKMFVFRTRRDGLDQATFHRNWQELRAPQLAQSYPFRRWVKRYVQSQMVDADVGLPGGVPHDLIDEFWFSAVDDAVAFWTAYRQSAEIGEQDAKHARRDKTWVIFAREHEVFGPLRE